MGLPIIRIILFWGLCWGPPFFGGGNYHLKLNFETPKSMVLGFRVEGLGNVLLGVWP